MKIEYLVISVISGLIVGFVFGRVTLKNLNIYQFLRKIYINLDNFILILSFIIVCGSIYFSTIGKLEKFASVAINVFASVVFSWLLTKKSSKEEFKEQEQELSIPVIKQDRFAFSGKTFYNISGQWLLTVSS